MIDLRKLMASAFVVLLVASLGAACSDDTDSGGQGGGDECASGESFNVLSGRCEPIARGNNDNNSGSDGATTPGVDGGTDPGSDAGGTEQCPEGQSYNPVSGYCEPDGSETDAGTNPGEDGGSSYDGGPIGGTCGPGTVIGKACAPSGELLAGATVTIEGFDCDGNTYTDTVQTDANGSFQFDDVPAGQHTLTISTGSFSRNQTIIVQNGQTLDLSSAAAKVCLDGGSVKIAVIEGAYDHVAGILDDLQLDYDIKGNDKMSSLFEPNGRYSDSLAFLKDSAAMSQYDIIFINCGELWNVMGQNNSGDVPTVIANLSSYLSAGNSLYVSDWSHPFLEKVFADAVDFHGDDQTINDARIGYAPQTISAQVTSQGLQTALGNTQATIEFPHDPSANPPIINNNWVVAEGAGASSTIHLQGDAQLCSQPFSSLSRCDSAAGTQPSSPLLISYQGAGGGTAIYTAFHNERQSALNQDMEKILKFLIFQL